MAELTSSLADFAKFVLITDAPIVGSVREEAVCEPSTGVILRFFGFSVISFGVAFVVSLILINQLRPIGVDHDFRWLDH